MGVVRPALLDGTLPGDRGFDPFNLASDAGALRWQRKAEIKHARLAMLAAAGWPIAELLHKDIASALHLPALLASGDGVSSLFWIAAISAASFLELSEIAEENVS